MKSKAIICAIAALSMGISGLAVAQRDDHRDDRRDGDHRQMRDNDRRDNDRRGDERHDNGRHLGQRDDRRADDHHWRRGDRLPDEYRGRQYVVSDWRDRHLSAPPRGYQWVQANGNYVLIAVATGVIASILLNQ